MSTNLNYKQVTNVSRRTWDTEAYEQRARARQQQEETTAAERDGSSSHRHPPRRHDAAPSSGANAANPELAAAPEFVPADPRAAGPEGSDRAFLRARQGAVDLESQVGTTRIVAPGAAAAVRPSPSSTTATATTGGPGPVGWHCAVCDCVLKDSHTYLDHINGRKHQRKLGYSMRVERSSKDQVLDKLRQLTRQKEKSAATTSEGGPRAASSASDHADVNADDAANDQRREGRQSSSLQDQTLDDDGKAPHAPSEKEQQRVQHSEQADGNRVSGGENDDEEEVDVEAEVDPALAAMMGFAGFGGGNKN